MNKKPLDISIHSEKKHMFAVCTIKGASGMRIHEGLIYDEISNSKIAYGVDKESISQLITDYQKASKKFVHLSAILAKGLPPVPSKDGHVEILVDPAKKVNIQEDGSADFRNISIFRNIKKGDVLAKKHPPVMGKNGIDVFNRVVTPEQPKEGGIEHGETIQFQPNTNEYIALTNGVFEEKENWINVNQLLKIDSNVGLETGNIDYDGDIRIAGNVQRGTSVKAKGSIIVDGIIESGDVRAENTISAKLGINTKREGEVYSEGKIITNYIESSNVFAHQGIFVGKSILWSKVISLKDLILSSPSSTITNSDLCVYGDIEVGVIGKPSGANVKIVIGKHYFNSEKYHEVKENHMEVKKEFYKKLEKVKELKARIHTAQNRLTRVQIDKIKKDFNDYKEIAVKKEQLQKDEKNYRANVYNPKPVKIKIKSIMYPGLEIEYRNTQTRIDSKYNRVVIVFDPKKEGYDIRPIDS